MADTATDVHDSLAAAVPPHSSALCTESAQHHSRGDTYPLLHRADVPERGKSRVRTCFPSATAA